MTACVYFVQAGDGGPIKIGYTTHKWRSRLSALQTGSPVRLGCRLVIAPATREDEQELHRHFAAYRLEGEWFEPGPMLAGFLDEWGHIDARDGGTLLEHEPGTLIDSLLLDWTLRAAIDLLDAGGPVAA